VIVENDFAVVGSAAEAGQIETVIVLVTGSQEDRALKTRVSKCSKSTTHSAIFLVDVQMLRNLPLGIASSNRQAEKAECHKRSRQTHGEADG